MKVAVLEIQINTKKWELPTICNHQVASSKPAVGTRI